MLIFCAVIFGVAIYTNQDNGDYRGDHKIVVQSVKMSLSRQDTAQYFWAANSVKI